MKKLATSLFTAALILVSATAASAAPSSTRDVKVSVARVNHVQPTHTSAIFDID